LNSGTVIKIGDFNSDQKIRDDNDYEKINDEKLD